VPYYGVAVVFGLLVLLLAGVLFLVFRNRRISQSYSRLLEQQEGTQLGSLKTTTSTSMVDSSVDLEAASNDTL
jgi:Na+/H+ antiporter NhaA